jgi:methyl coenzyme M reductase gamma subunit
MSYHLVGPWLSTTSTKKRKSTLTKKQQAELAEYNREKNRKEMESFSKSRNIPPLVNKFPDLRTPEGRSTSHIKSLNPTDFSPCTVKSIMDPTNLAKESPEVREAIIAKSQRIAPAYSKGAFQYITPDSDITDIGRKK